MTYPAFAEKNIGFNYEADVLIWESRPIFDAHFVQGYDPLRLPLDYSISDSQSVPTTIPDIFNPRMDQNNESKELPLGDLYSSRVDDMESQNAASNRTIEEIYKQIRDKSALEDE